MHSRIEQALSQMPAMLSEFLTPIVTAERFDATLSAEQFHQLLTLSGLNDADLRVALLPLAAAYAYVPISNFHVGAIARGVSGRLYFGANMEFSGAQLGQTIHAEQAAISHAWMKGEQGIASMTVNYSPCGHCRQFMNELSTATTLMIQLPQREEKSLQDYLPESFGPRDLGIESALMTSIDHGYNSDDQDSLVQTAIQALNRSHAPYTNNLSGVALRTQSGQEYFGSYAENAAFNPSLPPLQVALIQLRMAGEEFTDLAGAALVEMAQGQISHLADTQATLEVINPDLPLSYLAL
ncbi:cytidine deaminase [Vibrio metschnikovii]|nr:cytidine deaminase [Vibrio metschnikovii]EKO3679238.1 cytidine deaminase [Vibrio metschnikovii]EKO3681790.1 cytidine deaminase [Vibrio metschnikovii]EKO3754817.1 cytidine deaminase [Vibrio metschnikovii]EKO3757662.1 cytidine deaminase [Vibrio metschnikovii]